MCYGRHTVPQSPPIVCYTEAAEDYLDLIEKHFGNDELAFFTKYIRAVLRSNACEKFLVEYKLEIENNRILIDGLTVSNIHSDYNMLKNMIAQLDEID